MIGMSGYLGKRYIGRRREAEALALFIQTADLRMKLMKSGATLNELRTLRDEVLKLTSPTQCDSSRWNTSRDQPIGSSRK
jgi:hypothetical protein